MSPSAGAVVDKEELESALRFDLRPGNWVLWEGRSYEFDSLRGTQARILETHSRQLREVPVGDLRAMPLLPAPELDERLERQRAARCSAAFLEIARTVGAAISGVAPNPLLWGRLSAEDFLLVLRDVTTWSLTHFEPLRTWSPAEDLTTVEEQEGYGLVGRIRRLMPSDYTEKRAVRTLQDIVNPKVRGAALWVTHAMMSVIHPDASDRPTGFSPQERQVARLRRCAHEGRRWLADRQRFWPCTYVRSSWICVAVQEPSAKMSRSVHWQD
jgi:hypothetical protein